TLYGGAHPQQHLDDDSEDELLLTAESNQKLQQESIKSHTTKGKKSSYSLFHAQHPQAYTHEVCLLEENEGYVPNFIG
ncbi:hypothetical protein OEZ81_26065, partial [Leclercia adecarboxylata]|uniref:hypothetical protein n=1 Tax=Leclercia adecarboxylata TaxID=83655 RepID=UPI00234DC08C